MSITTKKGDDGTTGMMFNRRVQKNHPQVEAYGDVDELNAVLGCCRALAHDSWLQETIFLVQNDLVILMGELAVMPEDRDQYAKKGFKFVSASMVDRLTDWVYQIEKQGITYETWATPGKTHLSAQLDVARATCRRAERRVAALGQEFRNVNPEITRFLNRLSDLLWLCARKTETQINRS